MEIYTLSTMYTWNVGQKLPDIDEDIKVIKLTEQNEYELLRDRIQQDVSKLGSSNFTNPGDIDIILSAINGGSVTKFTRNSSASFIAHQIRSMGIMVDDTVTVPKNELYPYIYCGNQKLQFFLRILAGKQVSISGTGISEPVIFSITDSVIPFLEHILMKEGFEKTWVKTC